MMQGEVNISTRTNDGFGNIYIYLPGQIYMLLNQYSKESYTRYDLCNFTVRHPGEKYTLIAT